MLSPYEQITRLLTTLMAACRDREVGYRTGARGVRSDELKSLFWVYAEQSAQFTSALQREIERLGREPRADAPPAGEAPRGWRLITPAAGSGDEAAVLSECEHGEDVAGEAYERALQALPPEYQPLVVRQYNELKSAHHRIRALRDAAKPSHP
jgi:uncharacterized protein (TIGR02284 family)